MNKQAVIKIECDAQPLLLFTEIFESFLKRCVVSLDSCDLPLEFARIENIFDPTGTSKVLVRFYPSDAFLSFAGAIFARDFDFGTIEQAEHHLIP